MEGFVKNNKGVVINNDDDSLKKYQMAREAAKRQKELFQDILIIKKEVLEIKEILLEINNRLI